MSSATSPATAIAWPVAFEHDQVSFRWKDYAHGNKKRTMPLASQEFLRGFLLHVLPRGFVRIRSFGFLANRRRASSAPLSAPARRAMQVAPTCAYLLTLKSA
jgi:hypothetical protein